MIIDAHAHLGTGRFKTLAPADLLSQMSHHAVERALVCPVEELIVAQNRAGNDSVLEQVLAHPDQFIGCAVANPWFGADAEFELQRAFDQGLRVLKLHPARQGFSPAEDLVWPLIAIAARARAIVYIHSGSGSFGEPLQVADLAGRFPQIPFILGHAGQGEYGSDLARCHQLAPNVYFETSRNGPAELTRLRSAVGVPAIVFGSNLPESRYDLELANLRDIFGEPGEREAVLGGNLARLLAA
jgi:uncharacterized protein